MRQKVFLQFVALVVCVLLVSCTKEEKKEIVCWGDSLTSPHNGKGFKGKVKRIVKGAEAYPEHLQEMLGDDYEIINGGVGGESTLTIMARQGAYPMKLAHDVVIFKSDEANYNTFVGNNDVDAFLSTYNAKRVTPLLRGWDEDSPAQVNPCTINGKPFHLSSEAKFWREEGKYKVEYNYYIDADDEWAATDTLKSGSIVETYAMKNLRQKYANVFFIGQNGGFDDVADLIKQLKAMIAYSKSGRYIVISFHNPNRAMGTISRMKEMEDSLSQCFGKHFINLRKYMVTRGLADAGLQPTQADRDSIAKGKVPPQLMTDGTHFTSTGYNEIAKLVFSKMKELGY